MSDLKFQVLREAQRRDDGVALYAMLKNELYFLPHWFAHYRALGISEFLVVDDHSDDGSREYLLNQNDCTLLEANYPWRHRLENGKTVSFYARNMVPAHFGKHKWVVSVDADEFLMLPTRFKNIGEFAACLYRNQIRSCRAVMIDFFPERMTDLPPESDESPFKLCTYFDAITVKWPDLAHFPRAWSLDGVRPRLLRKLKETSANPPWLSGYRFATGHKEPLLFWSDGTAMVNAHRSNIPPRDSVQLVLAHFKMYPGWLKKVKYAIDCGYYWNKSIEYHFLDAAYHAFSSVSLSGPRTSIFENPNDLERAGLIYCKLH